MDLKLTFDDGSEGLAHYGRKGMKWGKHIFGQDENTQWKAGSNWTYDAESLGYPKSYGNGIKVVGRLLADTHFVTRMAISDARIIKRRVKAGEKLVKTALQRVQAANVAKQRARMVGSASRAERMSVAGSSEDPKSMGGKQATRRIKF